MLRHRVSKSSILLVFLLAFVVLSAVNVNVESVEKFSDYLLYATLKDNVKHMNISADSKNWNAEGKSINSIGGSADVYDAATKDYVYDNVAEWIDKEERVINNVAELKKAWLFPGMTIVTKGYYTENDGGNGAYKIREAKSTEVKGDIIVDGHTYHNVVTGDDGSVIGLYNGNVAELITDGVVNVKRFGAKGDGITDDTIAMKNAFATASTKSIFYIPNGLYIVQPKILNATLSHDITVFGDGKGATRLKLKNNSVTADNQPLFVIKNSGFIRICFHDLCIDMNRTNNKSVIDNSGDEWALQHCHAIFCYPQSGVKSMSVDVHDVEFYDLIADGVGCGGSGTKTYVDIMCRNIVSTGRQGTRSDICVTASYDNFIVSDCVLDALETEVNSYASGHNYIAKIDNVVTDKIDLDSDWKNTTADTQPQTRIANSVIRGIVAIIGGYYVFDDCQITLVRPTRLNSSMSIFTNCKIETKSITTGNAVFDSQANNTDAGIEFHNCDISNPYYNSIPFISMIGNATYAKHIVFDNCKINFASELFKMRSGNLFFTNNTVDLIQVDGETSPSSIGSIGSLNMDILAVIKDNNILAQNLGIITPPIAGSYKFYLNSRGNKTATLGLAINWTRYDKITTSRGGSGSIVECEALDDYQADAEPSTGKWVKGQKVYNKNQSASPLTLGWVCTTSGDAGTAVFTVF